MHSTMYLGIVMDNWTNALFDTVLVCRLCYLHAAHRERFLEATLPCGVCDIIKIHKAVTGAWFV